MSDMDTVKNSLEKRSEVDKVTESNTSLTIYFKTGISDPDGKDVITDILEEYDLKNGQEVILTSVPEDVRRNESGMSEDKYTVIMDFSPQH